jgi:hypothetical protein
VIRTLPAVVALGLGVLWVIGISVQATPWLTWFVGAAALPAFAVTGLIPEGSSAPIASVCLVAIGLGLAVLWAVGWAADATPWLTWWTFVLGGLCIAVALPIGFQGALERERARDQL